MWMILLETHFGKELLIRLKVFGEMQHDDVINKLFETWYDYELD
jgi:hypothetical protein